jgi:hypothetical protein
MLTVDDYGKIRIAHRDGMSIRAIARLFKHSRRKVREILANPQPMWDRARNRPHAGGTRIEPWLGCEKRRELKQKSPSAGAPKGLCRIPIGATGHG